MGLYAFILSTVLGIPLGVASAVKRDTIDRPHFPLHLDHWPGIAGLLAGADGAVPLLRQAPMLPDGQRLPQWRRSSGHDHLALHGRFPAPRTNPSVLDVVEHLIMPVMVLTYGSLAVVTRMVRGGMIEVLNQDYIRTARAKGLGQSDVVNRHALKNALLPTVTQLGSAGRVAAFGRISGRDHLLVAGDWPILRRCDQAGRLQRDHGNNTDRGGDICPDEPAGRYPLPLP